jgi:hypothetical protein
LISIKAPLLIIHLNRKKGESFLLLEFAVEPDPEG